MVDPLIPPVSGEIMARAKPRTEPAGGEDVIDAEFVTLRPDFPERTGRGPPSPESSVGAPATEPPAGMAMLAPWRDAGARRGGPVFWLAGLVAALAAFWISGGHALAPYVLSTDGAAAPAGSVRLADIRTLVGRHGARNLLNVDGMLANEGTEAAVAPALSIEVRGDDGSTTRYILDAGQMRIGSGERLPFSSRLDLPPGGVSGVTVTMMREGRR